MGFGSHLFTVLPTPGHTLGSISLSLQIDDRKLIFCGDLMAGSGKVWSLASTQWTYNGGEGLAYTVLSALDLKDNRPDLLLPSHGDPISEPDQAIDLLVHFLSRMMAYRNKNGRLFDWRAHPYERISPHLLVNLTGMSDTYVLLSDRGKALLIDFGYDFMVGDPSGSDRASRRPWLYSIPALKRDFGVTQIVAAIPTHYHDDHVAGLNLLREVEGTEVWAAENYAHILTHPAEYDLPCLWYDPIPVDRVLDFGRLIAWEEYTLELYPLPGHTRYAAAISFQIDGQRYLAIGDQYEVEEDGTFRWNYVYPNRFQPGDYRASADLICRLHPDVILTGHWGPHKATPALFDWLVELGDSLEQLHSQVNMPEAQGCCPDAFAARIQPYQVTAAGGGRLQFQVDIHNPYPRPVVACLRPVVPPGWDLAEREIEILIEGQATGLIHFYVTPPPGLRVRRARLAVDVTIGDRKFGQQAEALVTLE
jgi:glyoxylase-like metal-dependent hydrolase (beta-lactamase superfamily II)